MSRLPCMLIAVFCVIFSEAQTAEDVYSFFHYPMVWASAEYSCQSLNMTLVNVDSEAEQEALEEYMTHLKGETKSIWIGLQLSEQNNESESDSVMWTDGSTPQYTNWGNEQPDFGVNNTRRCAFMHPENKKWYMTTCWNKYNVPEFICQKTVNPMDSLMSVSTPHGDYKFLITYKTGQEKVTYETETGYKTTTYTVTEGSYTVQGIMENIYIGHGKLEDCLLLCQITDNCVRYVFVRFGTDKWESSYGDAYCRMYEA